MLLSIGAVSYAVIVSEWDTGNTSYILMCVGLSLFGFAGGVMNGPTQALLADSLPTGSRDSYYNHLFVLYLLGSVVGPVVCIVLFSIWNGGYASQTKGDWPLKDLRILLLIGLGLELPVAILMFCFSDEAALGKESEGISEAGQENEKAEENMGNLYEPLMPNDEDGAAKTEDGPVGASSEAVTSLQPKTEEGEKEKEVDEEEAEEEAAWEAWMLDASRMTGCWGILTVHHIPYVLFASDVVISLASGMTIKFFPLFFKDDCKMSLPEVQTVYAVVPLAMAISSTLGTSFSHLLGRVQTVLLLRFVGLSCFASMILLYNYKFSPIYVVVAYICRTALMNCTYPLEEGILMDYVPKSQRAKWKALESVSSFGWCGSAAIGGVIADKHGYTFCFLVTIAMQSCATLIYSSLVMVVASNRPQDVKEARKKRRELEGVATGDADPDDVEAAACKA